ncbi:hypothetical protein OXYTRIMIC_421 [Oxytricha trifallax]|uniref:Uncharacterized protein n=1 Tax=Oxytricha trifallax TaxID=1172189 RepID=A0A073I074_9SPIT|nr:hypothetical protein OXYTRIMIC_421 [Oxytricha trifallax]
MLDNVQKNKQSTKVGKVAFNQNLYKITEMRKSQFIQHFEELLSGRDSIISHDPDVQTFKVICKPYETLEPDFRVFS